MQVAANSQLNFVFFIPYVYIIVSLIFTFSIIRTLNNNYYPDYLLKCQRVRIIEVQLYLFGSKQKYHDLRCQLGFAFCPNWYPPHHHWGIFWYHCHIIFILYPKEK